MRATQVLHEQGQSLWLDNITRDMVDSVQLQHYIDNYAVTGLRSNPSIFVKAISSGSYDEAIRARSAPGVSDEELFFDLRRASGLGDAGHTPGSPIIFGTSSGP